jgi:hypothetical protein
MWFRTCRIKNRMTYQFTDNTEDKCHVIRELKYITNKSKFILANNSLALKTFETELIVFIALNT